MGGSRRSGNVGVARKNTNSAVCIAKLARTIWLPVAGWIAGCRGGRKSLEANKIVAVGWYNSSGCFAKRFVAIRIVPVAGGSKIS